MADPRLLNTAAALERAATVPLLRQLLADVVPADELPAYSEMVGNQPHLVGLGNTADALGRIGSDGGASDMFAVSILAGALVRVVARQQERIDELEKALAGKARKPAKADTK